MSFYILGAAVIIIGISSWVGADRLLQLERRVKALETKIKVMQRDS